MAGLLAKIGRGTYRHRWATLLAWLMILVAVASISVAVSKPESTQFTVPGTQSQQAMDLLEQRFPAASGATAQIVFAAPAGATLNEPTIKAGVEASLAKARQGAQVLLVTDPYSSKSISKNGRIGYATVAFKVPASSITADGEAGPRRRGQTGAGPGRDRRLRRRDRQPAHDEELGRPRPADRLSGAHDHLRLHDRSGPAAAQRARSASASG